MIDIKKLGNDIKNVKSDKYTKSYPHLISYFEGNRVLQEEDFIRGAHMVYAWMPTILRLNLDDAEKNSSKVVKLLNEAKVNKILNADQIDSIKSVIKNSVIGTSKLLHFISPAHFPIWDSNIYYYLNGVQASWGVVNSTEKYMKYMKDLRELIDNGSLDDITTEVNKKINYKLGPMTHMRAAELIMFQTAQKDIRAKKKLLKSTKTTSTLSQ